MAKESSYSSLELRALAAAGVSLTSELSLEVVLQKVADVAREQVGARYAALSVLGPDGAIERFITSGISADERQQIGSSPQGRGILGVMLHEGAAIRVGDMQSDSRSAGVPAHHPEMRSLLGVPVAWGGRTIGNLYLADKEEGQFTAQDEEVVTLLSTQAAVAVRNAELYEAEKSRTNEWKELFDLGREVTQQSTDLQSLMDSVVRRARRLLKADIACIMLVSNDGEHIEMAANDGLKTDGMRKLQLLSEDGLQGLALAGSKPVIVLDYENDDRLKNRPVKLVQEEGLVSQVCVPLRANAGPVGTITVGTRYLTDFKDREIELLEALANWLAVAIETHRLQAQVESMARLEERERIAMDLHDGVIQSIYAVGLQLEDIAEEVQEAPASVRPRIETAIDSLSSVIKDIRSYIFELRPNLSVVESLPVAIEVLAHELRVNSLIEAEVSVDPMLDGCLSESQSMALYHIAQEAMNNISKHSNASSATVLLTGDQRSVRLEISDNGRGLAPEATEGHIGQGIRNMRDRAKSQGASIMIESGPDGGTQVTVVMPLEAGGRRHG